ncbi:CRISPR-associated protein Cas7 [Labilibaculum filiforme]|uniref:CRISPR-associated protein Cas7 n=1 Tax=Labilibaculum filiforme TaxID=1940526 RepID=A0A2N3HZ75_9BACT|nr:CRISPR-associated protein Cas7 [Labilibaculum filiforme]PKQ63370.1 CRISPR-associated protein Cas7 [Labilibaculum filiforme]
MNTIYIRTLKRAEHTVFCVADGQKTYYDPQFNKSVPYSSGQQVKRSMIDALSNALNEVPSPTTFLFDVNKKGEMKEGEVFATCDPSYADQLFGGWMKASKGGKDRTIKRRSPLSISSMRGLHPLLAGIDKENVSFDRSDRPNNKVIVRDEKNNILDEEQITALLEGKDRSLSRKWIPDNKRAVGLFVQDMAIDLRRLFCVLLNKLEPEITAETEAKLREVGWEEIQTVFGTCLVTPKAVREKLIPALAHAIINWTITSNQSRTFSLMETLAVSVSDNANKIAGSIRAKLKEEEDNKAEPIIEEEMTGVESFVTLSAGGYIRTKKESADALDKAEQSLIDKMLAFDYENQLN